MIIHYMYHLWFKVCRAAKTKYKLSTNCLLVLNGAYVYNSAYHKPFTRSQLLKFCSYYDNVKIGKYITVLTTHGYIKRSGSFRQIYDTFVISETGIEVMNILHDKYNELLCKFCNDNNISL